MYTYVAVTFSSKTNMSRHFAITLKNVSKTRLEIKSGIYCHWTVLTGFLSVVRLLVKWRTDTVQYSTLRVAYTVNVVLVEQVGLFPEGWEGQVVLYRLQALDPVTCTCMYVRVCILYSGTSLIRTPEMRTPRFNGYFAQVRNLSHSLLYILPLKCGHLAIPYSGQSSASRLQ